MSRFVIPKPKEYSIKLDSKNKLIIREPIGEDMIKLEQLNKESTTQAETVLKTIIMLQVVQDGEEPLLYKEIQQFPASWIKAIGDKLNELQDPATV